MNSRSCEPQPGLREPIGFNRHCIWALLLLIAVIGLLLFLWPQLAKDEWNAIFSTENWMANMDWLLAGLGVFFLFCAAFDTNPKLDLATIAAGILGGTILEIWGTQAGVWYYYTGEKPPLWILPAWGMSALANERLQRIFMHFLTPKNREAMISNAEGTPLLRSAYCVSMSILVVFFLWWSRFYLQHPTTWLVIFLIVCALRSPRFPAYALSLFATGALLGIFLEIWGTTRHCWNYYDGKTPSPFPIFGHGMAALCFWKIKNLARTLISKI